MMEDEESSNDLWPTEKAIQLAQLLEANPCLWDPSNDGYYIQSYVCVAVRHIAEVLRIPHALVDEKIWSIIDQFQWELKNKRKVKEEAGTAKFEESKWFLFDHLKFLEGITCIRPVQDSSTSIENVVIPEAELPTTSYDFKIEFDTFTETSINASSVDPIAVDIKTDEFICNHCNYRFNKKFCLKRHIITKHMLNRWTCNLCPKSFTTPRYLTLHKEKIHEGKIFECSHCSKIFKNRSALEVHLGEVHKSNDKMFKECCYCGKKLCHQKALEKHVKRYHLSNSPKKPNVSEFRCVECNCSFFNKININEHYRIHHNVDFNVHQISFQTYADFENWRLQMQKKTITQFCHRNKWKSSSCVVYILHCHRSGLKMLKENSTKSPRHRGSKKLNAYCPAEIRVKVSNADGACNVEYLSTHVGHTVQDVKELKYIYLEKTERLEIAAKLRKGMSRRVLREKESVANSEMEPGDRRSILTRFDLYNIAKSFSISKDNDLSASQDMIEVDAFVEKNKNIVRYYKKKMKNDQFHLLEENDFVLVLMNDWQEQQLRQYGHRVIAFDCTHVTNKYDIFLYTMLVLDVDREGVPVSFVLTNRNDRAVINVFLSCIRDHVGALSPTTLMSDMQNSYLESWTEIMRTVPTYLYCTWHVVNDWKENFFKIEDPKKRNQISNLVYGLLLESNLLVFEQNLRQFLASEDPEFKDFLEYFGQRFAGKYVHYWAHCFRQCAGVTTIALEAFHRSIKLDVANSLRINDLSCVLHTIKKYLLYRDEESNVKTIRKKDLSKLNSLLANHQKASDFLQKCDIADIVTRIDENSFFVRSFADQEVSNSAELYLVSKILDDEGNGFRECCSYGDDFVCRLGCELCDICFHGYVCNCINASIESSMCKHIHAVGIFLKTFENFDNKEAVIDPFCTDAPELSPSLVNSPDTNLDEDLSEQRLSSPLSEEQKIEEEGRIMCDIVAKLIHEAKEKGYAAQHLRWLRKQYLEPMIPALQGYLLNETETGDYAYALFGGEVGTISIELHKR